MGSVAKGLTVLVGVLVVALLVAAAVPVPAQILRDGEVSNTGVLG